MVPMECSSSLHPRREEEEEQRGSAIHMEPELLDHSPPPTTARLPRFDSHVQKFLECVDFVSGI